MEWSKIKNIILLILLVVNGCLLWQVANLEWRSARYRQEAREDAARVLAGSGIRVDVGKLPEERRLRPMAAERSREAERKLAEALLGDAREGEKSGVYTGERGEGSFLSNGSFFFTFPDGAWSVEREKLEKYTLELLRNGGLEYEVTGLEEADGALLLSLRQTWEGTPLFNCRATVVWKDGALTGIEGQQRLSGRPAAASGEEAMNVPTALLRFLTGVRAGGHVCGEIQSLTAGYETAVSPNGTAKLNPLWQVVTDGGVFYVDGLTGALRQAE